MGSSFDSQYLTQSGDAQNRSSRVSFPSNDSSRVCVMESSADWQGLLRTADEVDNTLSEDSRDNTVTTSQTQKQGNYDQVLVQKLLTMASQVSNLLQPVVLNHDDDDGIPLEMRNRVEAALAQLQKLQRVASGD
jgi:hypothetical protein